MGSIPATLVMTNNLKYNFGFRTNNTKRVGRRYLNKKNRKWVRKFSSNKQVRFLWKRKNSFNLNKNFYKKNRKLAIKNSLKSLQPKKYGYGINFYKYITPKIFTKKNFFLGRRLKKPRWIRSEKRLLLYNNLKNQKTNQNYNYQKSILKGFFRSKNWFNSTVKRTSIDKFKKKLLNKVQRNKKFLKYAKKKIYFLPYPTKITSGINRKSSHSWYSIQQSTTSIFNKSSLKYTLNTLLRGNRGLDLSKLNNIIFFYFLINRLYLTKNFTKLGFTSSHSHPKTLDASRFPINTNKFTNNFTLITSKLTYAGSSSKIKFTPQLENICRSKKHKAFLLDYSLTHGLEDIFYYTYFKSKKLKFSYNTKYMLTSYLSYDFNFKKTWTAVFGYMNWYKGVSNSRRPNFCKEDLLYFFSSHNNIYTVSTIKTPRIHSLSFIRPFKSFNKELKIPLIFNSQTNLLNADVKDNYSNLVNDRLATEPIPTAYSLRSLKSKFLVKLFSKSSKISLRYLPKKKKLSGLNSKINLTRSRLLLLAKGNYYFSKVKWFKFESFKNIKPRNRKFYPRFRKPRKKRFYIKDQKFPFRFLIRFYMRKNRYRIRRKLRMRFKRAKKPKFKKNWKLKNYKKRSLTNLYFKNFLSIKKMVKFANLKNKKKSRWVLSNKKKTKITDPNSSFFKNKIKSKINPISRYRRLRKHKKKTKAFNPFRVYRYRFPLMKLVAYKYTPSRLRVRRYFNSLNRLSKKSPIKKTKPVRAVRWANSFLKKRNKTKFIRFRRLKKSLFFRLKFYINTLGRYRSRKLRKFTTKKKNKFLFKFLDKKYLKCFNSDHHPKKYFNRLNWYSILNFERYNDTLSSLYKNKLLKKSSQTKVNWLSNDISFRVTNGIFALSWGGSILKNKFSLRSFFLTTQSVPLFFKKTIISPILLKLTLSTIKAPILYGALLNFALKYSSDASVNTNLIPSSHINRYINNKMYTRLYKDVFQKQIGIWYNNLVIRFIEFIFGYSTMFQFFPFLEKVVKEEHALTYKVWMRKMGYYERRLGHKFFLQEGVHLIHISFFEKDAKLLFSWLKTIIQRISFWKTRFIFRFIKYIFLSHFQFYFPNLKAKGFKVKLKGKISVAGNSRKRTILFRAGKTSHTSVSLKVIHHKGTIVTFTGVMGFQVWIFY
uniref:Ribosomal protein S3b n=1 Tax=Strombidium cf. sulcatum TaxID=2793073 RepID=A0A7T0Q5A9_9SPIT|nr:ribosomal protein S3b [Strombidium cf. sulcatum]QPL15964.1 ribosomal protein S3b [Strombidium cf. sulcatum]